MWEFSYLDFTPKNKKIKLIYLQNGCFLEGKIKRCNYYQISIHVNFYDINMIFKVNYSPLHVRWLTN